MKTFLFSNKLIFNSIAGASQAIISSICLLLTYRVLLTNLGVYNIGIWSLLMAWMSLLRIMDFGITGAVVRHAAFSLNHGKKDQAIGFILFGVAVTSAITLISIIIIIIILIGHPPNILLNYSNFDTIIILSGLISWINCTSTAIRSGLDALQRVDLRHVSIVLQNITLLVVVIFLVPKQGFIGIFLAQSITSGIALILSAIFLFLELRIFSRSSQSNAITLQSIKQLFLYGFPYQITTITGLLLDPLVKMLLGHYSDIASVTWYEMSSRLVTQVRSIIINALESVVPHVASFGKHQLQNDLVDLYKKTFSVNLAISTLGLGLIPTTIPIICFLWIGNEVPTFLFFSTILAFTWWCNSISIPSYFYAQGLGIQRWNVISNALVAVTNLTVGLFLGQVFGKYGVLSALALAYMLGSAITIFGLRWEIRKTCSLVLPIGISLKHAFLLIISIIPLATFIASNSIIITFTVSIAASIVFIFYLYNIENNSSIPTIISKKLLK